MAYAVKYQYDFRAFQGDSCTVYFFFNEYSGPVTELSAGPKGFVLREFNTNQEFFKHIRGFQAEMEILSDGVTIDDFLTENETDIQVQLWVNGFVYWIGWLMQDDFQDEWRNSRHFFILRATDGLGQLATSGTNPNGGLNQVESYLVYALDGTPLKYQGATIINQLFYEGMNTASNANALAQAYLDAKTFEGDGAEKIVEKINKAYNQTIFQYQGRWWIVRMEHFLHPGNISGFVKNFLSNTPFSKSFIVNVGVTQDIVPIQPYMQKLFRRGFKIDRINFLYEFPNEIICNQSFLRGARILPTTDKYYVECWTLYRGNLGSYNPGTAQFYRKEEYDVDGNITDNYVVIERDPAQPHFMRSSGLIMNTGDSIQVEVDYRTQRNPQNGISNINVGVVQLEPFAGTTNYTLDDDGVWYPTNLTYSTNVKSLTLALSAGESDGNWNTYSVRSKGVPVPGKIYILLYNVHTLRNSDANFKGLQITIRESNRQLGVSGDFDRYTRPEDVRQNYEEQTYIDDANNRVHKGALFFNGELTGDRWFRGSFPSERLTFKRHKAIAHMLLDRKRRYKIDATLLGIMWTDGGVRKPIGLMNRFVFTDDAPGKQFMILNLKEIDFVAGTMSVTLIETWDSGDDDNPANYPTHDFGYIYESGN
jgi:hypothetical protein